MTSYAPRYKVNSANPQRDYVRYGRRVTRSLRTLAAQA
jgi:hypothetical protein